MVTFDETITVYNREFDPGADHDVYHKTVIRGCSWFARHDTGRDGTALHRENVHQIRIPNTAKCNKRYVKPTEYTNPETQYTLRSGDLIVKGVGADIAERNDAPLLGFDLDVEQNGVDVSSTAERATANGVDITREDGLEGAYYDRCVILTVHDNRRVGLKHIYVEGK